MPGQVVSTDQRPGLRFSNNQLIVGKKDPSIPIRERMTGLERGFLRSGEGGYVGCGVRACVAECSGRLN